MDKKERPKMLADSDFSDAISATKKKILLSCLLALTIGNMMMLNVTWLRRVFALAHFHRGKRLDTSGLDFQRWL